MHATKCAGSGKHWGSRAAPYMPMFLGWLPYAQHYPRNPPGGQASVREKITAVSSVVKGNLNLEERQYPPEQK